jgi:ketosteroid isomerase-like protein
MSKENVEVVERLIASVNERDVEAYLACCTDDIRLWTPWAQVEGAYEGHAAIRRFFGDLKDTLPDFRITLESAEPITPDCVLAFVRASVSGRASGIPAAAMSGRVHDPPAAGSIATANVYDFVGGKIASIRVFLNRADALEAVGAQRAENHEREQ